MTWVRRSSAVWFIWAFMARRAASGLPDSSAASTRSWWTMAWVRISGTADVCRRPSTSNVPKGSKSSGTKGPHDGVVEVDVGLDEQVGVRGLGGLPHGGEMPTQLFEV